MKFMGHSLCLPTLVGIILLAVSLVVSFVKRGASDEDNWLEAVAALGQLVIVQLLCNYGHERWAWAALFFQFILAGVLLLADAIVHAIHAL
jgi:hypothetical protein